MPDAVPYVNRTLDRPAALVVTDAAETDPPLDAHPTAAPCTGTAFWSVTSTVSDSALTAPTVSVSGPVVLLAMLTAPLICDTALNWTGVRLPVLALTVWVPALAPRVRRVFASPEASVTRDAGDTLPPPPVTVKATVTPATTAPP